MHCNARIILCPTTPSRGMHAGEKVGHLTCFDTKPYPYVGSLIAHHMHVLLLKKSMSNPIAFEFCVIQNPHLFPQHCPGGDSRT